MTMKPKTPAPKPRKKARNVPSDAAEQLPERKPMSAHAILNRPTLMGLVATKAAAGNMFGEIDSSELLAGTIQQVERIRGGDLAPVEAMLFSQAKALEALFTRLVHRGMGCDNIAPFQANITMALKAQAQCRATLQTLVEAKQPRAVAFVKQANIAQQQVNNGTPALHAHARERPKPENELLEDATHEQQQRMVPGAQAAPAGGNPAMETVGAVNRAEDARGEGNGSEQ